MEWAAKRRFPYLMVFTPIKRTAQVYSEYRQACERLGYTASQYQLAVNLPIVVAESDARAYEIARQNALWVYHVGLRMRLPFWQPPGYVTELSLRRLLEMRPKRPTELTLEDLDEGGYIICGSPATVRDKLRVFSDELKAKLKASLKPD